MTVAATPFGGYVLAGGHFRVNGDARTILDFQVQSSCAGMIVLPSIPLDATGAFEFFGRPPATQPGTVVHVVGRFVASTEAQGTTQVRSGTCLGKVVPFVARLS